MKKGDLLIVEDDKKIAEALKDYFIKENFNVSILNTGEKVVSNVKTKMPDLILLDIMLPDKDGITLCREIRSFSDVPIIFVTAKVKDIDRLLGLELGADDYICKPFLPQEVVARVKAVIRRTRPDRKNNRLVAGAVDMNDETHKVTVDGANVNLTPIEYNLLKIMMSAPDKVFTRADLLSSIHGSGHDYYRRTIDNHIKNLRKKINSHLSDKKIIHTVHGVGYKITSSQHD